MFEDDVTVPAGWYPDPMGLPQLRWWNNHAWTELTTDARPPLVMQQPTRLIYADDELPTRRQQREQRQRDERNATLATDDLATDGESARDGVATHAPVTVTLREIDASTDGEPDEPGTPSAHRLLHREQLDEDDAGSAESFDDAFQPRSATSAVAAPTAQSERARTVAPEDAPSRRSTIPRLVPYTAPVWIIALIPLLQLVVGLLWLVGVGAVPNAGVGVAVLVVPYLAVVALAVFDRAALRRAGHEHTAHWAWAFLSAPVYLVARSMALSRVGGLGLGPLLVWVAFAMLQGASVLVVPGMLISVIPAVFSSQAEQSVVSEAAVVGAQLDVTCPSPPPLLVGQQFTCAATSAAGQHLQVTVQLQRANGWIDWRVNDWGNTFTN